MMLSKDKSVQIVHKHSDARTLEHQTIDNGNLFAIVKSFFLIIFDDDEIEERFFF